MTTETTDEAADPRRINVASDTPPKGLAGLIAELFPSQERLESRPVFLHCVGAGAINNAVKGSAIAGGMVMPQGYDLWLKPSFRKFKENGEEKTSLVLKVQHRES